VITANGYPVLSGRLVRPLEGRWTATLHVDTDTALAGPVELLDSDSAFRAVGAVHRGGVHLEAGWVRLVAGTGGLLETVPARAYRGVPARIVVSQLLTEVGETLADDADAALLATLLPSWMRATGAAAGALGRLVTHLGVTWRAHLEGEIWIGTDAWPTVELEEDPLEEFPAEGRVELGAEAIDQRIAPGTLLFDRRVSSAVWAFDAKRTRCSVTYLDG
jgi:hypothetical protein